MPHIINETIVDPYDVFLFKKHIIIILEDGTRVPPYVIFDFNKRAIGDFTNTCKLLEEKAGEDLCSTADYDTNKGYISERGLKKVVEGGTFLFNFRDILAKCALET